MFGSNFPDSSTVKFNYKDMLDYIVSFFKTSLNPQFASSVWREMSKREATIDIWNYYTVYEGVNLPKDTLIDISGIEGFDFCIAMVDTDLIIPDVVLVETRRGPTICINRAGLCRDDKSASMFMILYNVFKFICGELHRFHQAEYIKIGMKRHGVYPGCDTAKIVKMMHFDMAYPRILKMIDFIDPNAMVMAFIIMDNLEIYDIDLVHIIRDFDCLQWIMDLSEIDSEAVTKEHVAYKIIKDLKDLAYSHDISINAMIYSKSPYLVIKDALIEVYEKDEEYFTKMVNITYNRFKYYTTGE